MEIALDGRTRRTLYRCVEAARWTNSYEAAYAARVMSILRGIDDFNAAAPGMDPNLACHLAEIIKTRGINTDLVDALVSDLQRIPVDLDRIINISFTSADAMVIILAWERILNDPQVDGPLVRGATAELIAPVITMLRKWGLNDA